jgi:hypothetical protein
MLLALEQRFYVSRVDIFSVRPHPHIQELLLASARELDASRKLHARLIQPRKGGLNTERPVQERHRRAAEAVSAAQRRVAEALSAQLAADECCRQEERGLVDDAVAEELLQMMNTEVVEVRDEEVEVVEVEVRWEKRGSETKRRRQFASVQKWRRRDSVPAQNATLDTNLAPAEGSKESVCIENGVGWLNAQANNSELRNGRSTCRDGLNRQLADGEKDRKMRAE